MRKEENKPEAPERKITMGSLFDGVGGFPLAAVRNGIEPVWASEIEAFPIAVTKLRFPQMQHVGDIPGASDSARYKALGNSVAIPCVELLMLGIALVLRNAEDCYGSVEELCKML